MNKIKFDFAPQKNNVVKFQGQKIEIMPFIGSETLLLTSKMFQNLIEQDPNSLAQLSTFKIIFDMVVVAECTNIKIDFIKKEVKDGVSMLNLDVNKQEIETFESIGLRDFLKENISNYEDSWEDIQRTISNIVVFSAFSLLGNRLPKSEDMVNTIKEITDVVKELRKEAPEELAATLSKPIIKKAQEKTKAKTKVKS